jgi:hypothetical protein
MIALPKSVDYSTPMATMPAGTVNYLVSNTPINNSSFTPGSTIIVDLNNISGGYLDPASLSIRYKYVAVTTTCQTAATTVTLQSGIVGCPLYSPLLRFDLLANSSVVESINNYNTVATMLTNVGMSVSEKLGQALNLGYCGSGGDTMDNQFDVDGHVIVQYTGSTATQAAVTATNYVSGPIIGCSLANAEKLIPLDINLRLQFTLDSLANIGSSLTTDFALASYTITNFEVVYNQIQFPNEINQQIRINPKIRIKTKSFAVGSQAIPASSSGTINLYYNLRYASIRSLYLLCTPTVASKSASKAMESVDVTTNNGSYQFSIGGVVFPQNPLSTLNNKSGILNELRRAQAMSLYDKNNSMAIGGTEFLYTQADTTSISVPGKFIVSCNTMKLTENQDYMFSGVSSSSSQINVIINAGTATTNAVNAYLVANYDALFEYDFLSKNLTYIQ